MSRLTKIWDWICSPTTLLGVFATGCGFIAADLTPHVRGVGPVVYVVAAFASFKAYAHWIEP